MITKTKNKDILLLGAGPSLGGFSKEKLIELAQDKVVFAIKQAQKIAPEIVDYHFLNENNLENYDYSTKTPHVVMSLISNIHSLWLEMISDTLFVVEQNQDFSRSLSSTKEFDKWTIANSPLVRPWGPGLIWETVLFFAYSLVNSSDSTILYSVGVDLAEKGSTQRPHFYSSSVVNPANKISQKEADGEIDLSKDFYLWLRDKGVEWRVLSDSFLHEDIPRVNINECIC